MVLLPIAAAALLINAMLVVDFADYVTERNEAKADQGMPSEPEPVEAISGM